MPRPADEGGTVNQSRHISGMSAMSVGVGVLVLPEDLGEGAHDLARRALALDGRDDRLDERRARGARGLFEIGEELRRALAVAPAPQVGEGAHALALGLFVHAEE